VQLGVPQEVEVPGYAQLEEAPLHEPAHAPVPLQLPWPAFGAPVTLAQTPLAPHASQVPLQALSQQTPSAQKVLVHSVPLPHDAPLVFRATHLAVPGSQ
jgi:hypothetical protein